ncbi:MAG: ribonuclease P protein component [Candidatus Liberibacter europaeus]|uniref:Ribonuclease P protein component n=1 Tax=Candidatus Liberibacter europaeus TaxID=744859 RepID=A0A2T4VZ85_9HYPH|nr:ribonuclease P protein component [Candidatus Liberibacter europaeus]PTL87086.1 MAG: ribonuclease P protein component [Candidatus Liberibacter europaeus]
MTNVCRLKNRRQFVAVKSGALRRRGAFFSLDILDHKNSKLSSRIGFTVTKRQGGAVERNRIRRRLKEVVRLRAEGILKAGHDYVVIAKRSALFANFEDLCIDFVKLASRKKQIISLRKSRF